MLIIQDRLCDRFDVSSATYTILGRSDSGQQPQRSGSARGIVIGSYQRKVAFPPKSRMDTAQLPPFATAGASAEASGEKYPADFHMQVKKLDVTEKAGKGGFDQAVYLANRVANADNVAHSKARNNGGTPYSLHNVGATAPYEAKEFHMQQVHKPLPDKIGTAGTFDPEAYRESLAANMARQQQTKLQTHGSAGQDGGCGGNSGSGCPFATVDDAEVKQQWQRSNYHAKSQPKCMAGKVGADKTFEPSVYSHNIEVNRQQQADSLQRSYVGAGDILAFAPGGVAK